LVEAIFKKGSYGFEECHIEGHAGYNPGNDIVCSAVSALGYALVGALKNINGLSIREMQAENGIDVIINPFIEPSRQRAVDMVFTTVYIGLKQIEQAYPGHVQVKQTAVL
jgi:uncharacterized protein YsxB (DUF464 family)